MQLLKSLCEALLQLLFITPIALLAQTSFSKNDRKYIAVFCTFFIFQAVVSSWASVYPFTGQHWNWFGKIAGLAVALGFVYFTPLLTRKEMGLTLQTAQSKGTYTLVTAFVIIRLILQLIPNGICNHYDTETFFFEATLPGIVEELIFRGILLGLLNRVFIPKWTFLKTHFGWGLLITSVLFGLVHGLLLRNNWALNFSAQRLLMTAGLGFVFGFIKEKSKSLFPSILLHNAWNVIVYWGI